MTSPHPSTRQILHDLLGHLDGVAPTDPTVTVTGDADPLCPSPHRLGEMSAVAIAAFGWEAAALDADRGGLAQQVTVTTSDALDQLRAPYLTTVNGVSPHSLSDDPTLLGLNDFYATSHGWAYLLSTYPHLRAAVCAVLNCPPTATAIAAAAQRWQAEALEEAVVGAGGVAVAVRTAEQWAKHPVGHYLSTRPVVEVEKIGESQAVPLPPLVDAGSGWAPLAGVKLIDNTHVIAGPVAGKVLGTFGADVLHTSRADRPDPLGMLALTGGSKRNAYADLRDSAARDAFGELVDSADVMLSAYRNVAQFGYDPQGLAARRPGIIAAELHCWGPDGPWAQRGGFDQLACAATGFSLAEGEAQGLPDGRPALPPTYLLNDYLAAYLVAAGVVAALRRRAVEGGSWRVRVNLARVCMWVRDQGVFAATDVRDLQLGAPTIERHTVTGPLGTLTEPVIPLRFSGHPTPTPAAPTLLGTAPLAFTTTE